MRLKINYNNMMKSALIPDGFTAEEIQALPLSAAFEAMKAKRPQLKWMELPHNQDKIVSEIEKTAAWVREEAEAFVVLGIGGSALGPIAIQQALNHLHYNELPANKRGGPRFYVEDNIDGVRIDNVACSVSSEPADPDGDLNGDGATTTSDALIALRAAMHLIDTTEIMLEHGDMDGNGSITATDAMLILRTAMGIIS